MHAVVVALVAVAAGLPGAAGCSIEFGAPPGLLDGALPSSDSSTAPFVTDGGGPVDAASTKPVNRGSPLCRATRESCFPDEGAIQCGGAPVPVDAGPIGDDAATVYLGDTCRVTLSGPSCAPIGALRDGAECKASSDCGAGSDCVLRSDGMMGQCRKYCCAGTCSNVVSPSGGATFCDVVQLAEESSVLVPVCMPVKSCKLLVPSQCVAGETCAVAAEDGTTSCVPTGAAKSGEPCDETHCAEGLTCVGKSGARKCFELCRVGGSSCGADLTCKNVSLIKDSAIGLCQPR